jgi:hypothetical protein
MIHKRRLLTCTVFAVIALCAGAFRLSVGAAESLPSRLTDQEFWRLTDALSEPNGYFQSDNLLSNEIWMQYVIPDLLQRTRPGGVYLGVGPEQNFTYIAATKPKMVFVPDIRRGNLELQLMYKALFEMSADRADFVSRLFSRKRPQGLTAKSTALEIFNAYDAVDTGGQSVYDENLKAIYDVLTQKHRLPLAKEDLQGIEYVYYNFYWFGPGINYNSSTNNRGGGFGRGGNFVSYADLMVATDADGVSRSYLSSEDNFKVLKDLEERDMIVPVVGNLGGPKMVRAVGKYVRDHGATISAFYLSNVEQYLSRDGLLNDFCRNIISMPLDSHSTFIRSQGGGMGGFGLGSGGGGSRPGGFGRGGGLMSVLGSMQEDTRGCAAPAR